MPNNKYPKYLRNPLYEGFALKSLIIIGSCLENSCDGLNTNIIAMDINTIAVIIYFILTPSIHIFSIPNELKKLHISPILCYFFIVLNHTKDLQLLLNLHIRLLVLQMLLIHLREYQRVLYNFSLLGHTHWHHLAI